MKMFFPEKDFWLGVVTFAFLPGKWEVFENCNIFNRKLNAYV